MLQLNISTQPIRLDYTIQKAQLNQQSTPAKVQMETTPATLEIRQPHGELTIDQTPCRYSIGLKNNADFARDNAELGRQTAMDTIGRIAEEGDRMAHIASKEPVFANLAAESSIASPLDITWAPIAAPDIQYHANPVEFNPIAGNVNLTVQPGTVQGDYQPGSVDIKVSQYPSVEISAVDVKV